MKKTLALSSMLLLLAAAGTVHAGFGPDGKGLASWDNSNQAGNQEYTVGKGASHITATNMFRSSGLATATGAGSLNASNWGAGKYIQFGFKVDQGYTATLSKLYIGTIASTPGMMKNIGVYSSIDNYTTAITSIPVTSTQMDSIISLAGLGTVSGEFNIRLMALNSANSSETFGVTNYKKAVSTDGDGTVISGDINGATPTPIPAAAWLLGSGLLGLAGVRRKQQIS